MPDRKKHLLESKPGYMVKAGVYAARLPRYINYFETHINQLLRVSKRQAEELEALKSSVASLSEHLETISNIQDGMDTKIASLKHQALLASQGGQASRVDALPAKSVNDTMADDHSHDKFYKDFEDRFRGSEDMIKQRLTEYSPYLKSLSNTAKKHPVLDIGCGRGEFLDIAKQNGLKAIGVDMNESMVERAKGLGYEAYQKDALSYLLEQAPSSYSVITGFHLVEHIPFSILLKIFEECYRVIHKEGFVLFETPNPNNLTVGASNFYMDPSHIKPIPPKLLAFAMESQGFTTRILELHPAKENIKHQDPIVEDMMRMVYGPLDYAVLASKKPFRLNN